MAGSTDTRAGKETRVGEDGDGFPHGSKYPFFVGLGLFLSGAGLAMWLPVLIVGLPVLAYGMWGWTYEYAVEEYESAIVPEQKRQLLGVKSGYLAMVLVVGGELIIFAGLFVAWFYLDATRGPFPIDGFPGLTVALGGAMTAILLVGSLTVRYGRNAVVRNSDRGKLVVGYAITVLLGVAFLAVLGFEWSNLMAEGLAWTDGPYGASYYALTGLHAGHLIAGIVMLAIVVYRARVRNHFSAQRNLMVRVTEVYWHFLTAVSMAIFVFVYFGTG